jgi:hypothetical protein
MDLTQLAQPYLGTPAEMQKLLREISTNSVYVAGDPTGNTSSQDAIVEAIDDASVNNAAGQAGQEVILPFGLYEVNETIIVPNRVRLVGSSARGTQVKASADFVGDHVFEYANGTSAMFDTGMEYMTVHCNSVAGLSGILHNAPHENTDFKNILITGFDTYGLEIANAYEGSSHFLVTNCEIHPDVGATGIYFDPSDSFPTSMLINGLTIHADGAAGTTGINIVGQYARMTAVGYHAEECTDMVYVTGANASVLMLNCRGQSTVTTMVRHLDTGNNRRTTMIGCSKQSGTNFFSDGTYTETADIEDFKYPHLQAFAGDATPSVVNRASTVQINGSGTDITGFDFAVDGQEWLVSFAGTITVDFSANSVLVGNAGVDFDAVVGDAMYCRHYNGVTYCFIANKA